MRPFNLSKVKKATASSGISYGFNDPVTWLDTGCYALNYLIGSKFDGGVPLEGKFTMFAGDSGSGKSYIGTANIIKDCQKKKIWPVFLDTENALDMSWMEALGVDTEAADKWSVASVDQAAMLIASTINSYVEETANTPYSERPKMCIFIDSLGMLITPTQERQFEEGDQKGDLGIKAKMITNMLRNTMAKIANQPIGLICTNHVFDSQDKYKPDSIPGGKMVEFASSVIVQMNKYMLKEDEFGTKLLDGAVAGIRTSAVVRKSRYAKPFEKLKIDIPYETGMDPYSGLFDLFEGKGLIKKDGARYTYASFETGEVFKDWRKNFKANGWLDVIMKEQPLWDVPAPMKGFDDTGSGFAEDGSVAV